MDTADVARTFAGIADTTQTFPTREGHDAGHLRDITDPV
ncbi:hypothetical protein I552_4079 [Mycobacterium xenopi 3993]|nr:hypothetical protein I552_4079 [Mycobacterium xenopi 3993]